MNYSDDFFNFGNAGEKREFISLEARAILVEKILTFAGTGETSDALQRIGIRKKDRCVMIWLKRTREWLGIGDFYPKLSSERYRAAVRKWIGENGRPTRTQILAGWRPRVVRQAK